MEERAFKPDWPPSFRKGNRWIIYQIQIDDQVHHAYVDDTAQYQADGLQWRNAHTDEYYPKERVKGWRETS